jgi:hypothetical protein
VVTPDPRKVTGTTPEGTTVTVETDSTGHSRVIIAAAGAEVMVGTTFVSGGTPHFWPGPMGDALAFSPTTLRLLADLIEQAHQEN